MDAKSIKALLDESFKNLNVLDASYQPILKKIFDNRALLYQVGISPDSKVEGIKASNKMEILMAIAGKRIGAMVLLNSEFSYIMAATDTSGLTLDSYVSVLASVKNAMTKQEQVRALQNKNDGGSRFKLGNILPSGESELVLIHVDMDMRRKVLERQAKAG